MANTGRTVREILEEDYNLVIQDDNSFKHTGQATVYDDLRVSPNNAPNLGANSPLPERVSGTEPIVSVAKSISMNGTDGKGLVPYYADQNTASLTINMWMVVNDNNVELIDRNVSSNGFELYHTSNRIYFKPGKGSSDARKTAYNSIINGGKYMVTVTCENDGSGGSRVKIYINGDLKIDEISSGELDTTNTTGGYILGEWQAGGWNFDGNIDNTVLLNVIATDAQVTEWYNAGAGIYDLPTGIAETTDVIANFKFDEGTGTTVDNDCTLGASNDITLSGTYIWDEPLVDDGGEQLTSFGVILDAFYPNVVMEKFFTIQYPHGKLLRNVIKGIEGTVFTHLHWYGENLNAGDVVWKLEFFWNQAGLSIPYTTIVERVVANDTVGDPDNNNKPIQRMNNLPTDGINPPMDEEHVSSTMACRIYRDGTDSRDTYQGKVYLHEFDAHVEFNTQGSRNVNSK